MTRLLVITHQGDAESASFAQWWQDAEVGVETVRPWLGEGVPSELGDFDGLVVFGGTMNCEQDAKYAWLRPTRELMARTARDGGPVLGVCLGHQMLAVSLGGSVHTMPEPIIGVTPIGVTGERDELFDVLPADARSIHFNYDCVAQPPDGAVVLARSPNGAVQAMRVGPRAWGLQFHPEASPDGFAVWVGEHLGEGTMRTVDAETMMSEVRAAAEELAQTGRLLALRFAELAALSPG